MKANVYVDGFNLYYSALRRRFPDPSRDVEIFLGQFRSGTRWMRRAEPCPSGSTCPAGEGTIRVIATEEKGSDVNLASHLLLDAFRRDCELAIVLTNDTDLVEPIRLARERLGLQVALLSPSESPARSLRTIVDVVKKIRHGALQASQLPAVLRDGRGDIHRPRAWRPEKR